MLLVICASNTEINSSTTMTSLDWRRVSLSSYTPVGGYQFFRNTVLCFQPMRGIRMMCIAIQKAQQSPTQLTSIHTDLAQVRQYTVSAFSVGSPKNYCNFY